MGGMAQSRSTQKAPSQSALNAIRRKVYEAERSNWLGALCFPAKNKLIKMIRFKPKDYVIVLVTILVVVSIGYSFKTKTDGKNLIPNKNDEQKLDLCLKTARTDYLNTTINKCESSSVEGGDGCVPLSVAVEESMKQINDFKNREHQCAELYPLATEKKKKEEIDDCIKNVERNAAGAGDNYEIIIQMGYNFCFETYGNKYDF